MADVVQIKPCKAVYVNVTSVIHSGKIITWLLHFFTTGAEYEDPTLSNLHKRLYFYTINNSKKSEDTRFNILLRQAFNWVWVPAHRTAKKLCTVCLFRSVEYINDLCITEYEWLLPLATLTWATAGAVYLSRLRNWTCRGFCGVILLLRLLTTWKSHIALFGFYHCHLVDIYHLFYFFFIAPGRVMFTSSRKEIGRIMKWRPEFQKIQNQKQGILYFSIIVIFSRLHSSSEHEGNIRRVMQTWDLV